MKHWTLTVTLTCMWGYGAGHKWKPEVVGTYNRRWKARLAKCWNRFIDQRLSAEYEIIES